MTIRQIPAREFSRGRRTIHLLRSGASADRRKLFRSFSDGGALPRRRYGWRMAGFWFGGGMSGKFRRANFHGGGERFSFSVGRRPG